MPRHLYTFTLLTVFSCAAMEEQKVIVPEIESLVEEPLENFGKKLTCMHENLVANDPDKLSGVMNNCIQSLYESCIEEQNVEKLRLAVEFYTSQLTTLEFKDILKMRLYLDSLIQEDSLKEDPLCSKLIRKFYEQVKEMLSCLFLKNMSPRHSSSDLTPRRYSARRYSDSPGRSRKKMIESPRVIRRVLRTDSVELSPVFGKKGIIDGKELVDRQGGRPGLKRSKTFNVSSPHNLPGSKKRSGSLVTKTPRAGSNKRLSGSLARQSSDLDVKALRRRSSYKEGDLIAQLKRAAINGDANKLQCLVKELEEEEGALDTRKKNLIFWAIEKKRIMLAILLLKYGVSSVDLQDLKGSTPLMEAIKAKNDAFYFLFLNESDDYSLSDCLGQTALHFAARGGLLKVVKRLLKKDHTLLDKQNNSGRTALMEAIMHEEPDAVPLLLRKGADLITCLDENGNTALHLLARSKTCATKEICAEIKDKSVDELSVKNSKVLTPLLVATFNENTEMAEWLIKQGVDAICVKGVTPLMLAVQHDQREYGKKLLNAGVKLASKDSDGNTALHRAAQHGKGNFCSLIIKSGSDEILNIRNNKGYTPLMYAAQEGQDFIVLILLNAGANTQCLGNDGKTALVIATEIGSAAQFELAKHKCKQCDCPHSFLEELFLCAVSQGNVANVRVHLENNVFLADVEDDGGNSALTLAAGVGHLKVVKLLVEMGADKKYIPDALKLAKQKGHASVVSFLKKL